MTGSILFSLFIAVIGGLIARRGYRGLRRDWRDDKPWLDRMVARAVAPTPVPPKGPVIHALARTSQWMNLILGVILLLLAAALFAFTLILSE